MAKRKSTKKKQIWKETNDIKHYEKGLILMKKRLVAYNID